MNGQTNMTTIWRKLSFLPRWRHMKSVHPEFELGNGTGVGAPRHILWRGKEVGRTLPLTALARPKFTDCFIVASGPSLASQDLSVLRGRTCIGVNGSICKAEESGFAFDYHVIADRKFAVDRFELVERILQSPADCLLSFRVLNEICARRAELLARDRISLLSEINSHYGVARLGPSAFRRWAAQQTDLLIPDDGCLPRIAARHPHRVGFSRRLDMGVFTAQTVAFIALQIAYALECRRAFLLGVDLGGDGFGRFYENASNAAPTRLARDLEPYILPSFELTGRLRESFAIFNLSPDSALPEMSIPRLTLEQAIELCDRSNSDECAANQ